MPTVKLIPKETRRDSDLVIRPEPRQDLESILLKHIDRDLFESETLDDLILASGGVVRELIRIASECVFICFGILRRYSANEEVRVMIDEDVLTQAKNKIWRDMSLAIGNKEREILEEVYDNFKPNDQTEETFLNLLKGVYIIEYRNDTLWYDLHPIVAERWQLV
jgi:hypothetical protein